MNDTTLGMIISSSVVVAKALGYTPNGVPMERDGVCACCGLRLHMGDLSAPFRMSQAFTDDIYLAARGSPVICGYCAILFNPAAIRASGFGAFGADGAKPFRKWNDITEALLNPPQPPFVMVYATANNQHMAWRAPVNFSQDAYYVRVGLRDLLVRRNVVTRAIDACRLLANAKGIDRGEVKGKTLPNPYVFLSSDLKEPNHAVITARVGSKEFQENATQQERDALQFLRQLSLGETWALRFVLTPNAGKASAT